MSEISFFEVFAGTDIRSPSVFRGFLGSVPLSAVAGSRAVQASAVFSFSAASIRGGCSLPFLFPSCPSFSCACSFLKSPSQFPREALGSVVLLLLRVSLCESPSPSSVFSSAPGPVACPYRCVPRPGAKRREGGGRLEKAGKSMWQAGKNRKNPKKSKKNRQKVWKSGKERYLCSPVREGGLGASSADRGKFIESEEGSPSGAGRAGPLRPGSFSPAGARKEDESRIIQ